MSRNHTQLSLLADHIKLSLLERQRAKALQLDSRTQDAEISRSLESLRNGVSALNGQEESVAGLVPLRVRVHSRRIYS